MRAPTRTAPRPAPLLALLLAALGLALVLGAVPAAAEEGRDGPSRCFDGSDDCPSTTTTAKPTTTTTAKPTTTTTAKPTTTTTVEPTTSTTTRRRRTTTTTTPPTTAGEPAPAPGPTDPPTTSAPAGTSGGTAPAAGGGTSSRAATVETADPTLPVYAAPSSGADPNPFLAALEAVGGVLPSEKVRPAAGAGEEPAGDLRTSLATAQLEGNDVQEGVSPVVWVLAGLLGLGVLAAVLRLDRRFSRR